MSDFRLRKQLVDRKVVYNYRFTVESGIRTSHTAGVSIHLCNGKFTRCLFDFSNPYTKEELAILAQVSNEIPLLEEREKHDTENIHSR